MSEPSNKERVTVTRPKATKEKASWRRVDSERDRTIDILVSANCRLMFRSDRHTAIAQLTPLEITLSPAALRTKGTLFKALKTAMASWMQRELEDHSFRGLLATKRVVATRWTKRP